VLLLAAGLIPYALSAICEAIFQGWERMRLIAIANIPVNVVKIVLAFALLETGLGLDWVIGLLVGSYVAIVLIEWFLILTRVTVPHIALRWGVSVWLARSTVTFLGIDGIIAITGSLNVILLSKFRGETEVGLYNAGTQLMVPVSLIYASIVISVFPLMCRRYEPTLQGIKRIGERVIELILSVALPTTVGLFLLSGTAIDLLYGSGLRRAELSMQIMVWGLILSAMTSILGQVLVASLRERVTLRIVAVDLIVSVVAGVPLIWQFGFAGAAVTALLTRGVDLFLHYRPVANLFRPQVMLQSAWKPVLATGVLAIVYFEMSAHGELVAAAGCALAYIAAYSGLMLVDSGGPKNVKLRYAYLWSE
jgi:O-antigen/teichoic acid export membrane protein